MGLEMVNFHSNPKERQCQKYSSYCTVVLISHASKVVLKILQARLQQYMNQELLDVQVAFRKGRGNRDQIANIRWIIEKARECQKNIYFCFKTDPSLCGKWKGKKQKKSQILFSWVPKALCTVTAAMTFPWKEIYGKTRELIEKAETLASGSRRPSRRTRTHLFL